MITIQGQYNTAICYTNELEGAAREQIQAVCDRPEFAGCKIRIMPDVHAGKGCTIGTTMTIQDKIVPGMVGVDIGCGMETVELAEREIDLEGFHRATYEYHAEKLRAIAKKYQAGIGYYYDAALVKCEAKKEKAA